MGRAEADRQKKFRIALRSYGPFEDAIRQQWGAFEIQEKTGLTLDVAAFEVEDLERNLLETGALVDGEWDVVFVNTDWIAALAERRALADLSRAIAVSPPEGWPDAWAPSLLRLQAVAGTILGLPYHNGPECLILRSDLFENADNRQRFLALTGRDLAPPRTWQEFRELAIFFNAPERSLFGTAFAAFPDGHNSTYDFLLQLWTRGGELVDDTGRVNFETTEADEALAFYREIMRNRDATHPACKEMDSVRSGQAFAAGEIAFMVNWFGFATKAHTDTHSRVRGNVTVTTIPSGEIGCDISLNVYWLLSQAEGSPHPATCWKFLRHVASPAMDLITSLAGAIGCRYSTWSNEIVNRTVPFYRDIQILQDRAREVPRSKDWPVVAKIIDELIINTLNTDSPISDLLRQAQFKAAHQLPLASLVLL